MNDRKLAETGKTAMDMFHFQELMRPQIVHAISVHFPIVLALLGIPLVYLVAVASSEKNTLLWVAIVCYIVFTVGGFVAAQAGEKALQLVPATGNAQISRTLHRHEEMAEKAWIAGVVMVVLLLLCLIRIKLFRAIFLTAGMIGSIFLGGWLVLVAHLGGILVYVYGVGTPDFLGTPAEQSIQVDNLPQEGQHQKKEEEAGDHLIPIREIDPEAAAEISYKRDIQPLFERYCVSCHGDTNPKGGISLTSVEAMRMSGRKAGPGLIPGKPDQSSIVKYVRGELRPRMPKGQPPLSEIDLHVIRGWIAAGAIDDTEKTDQGFKSNTDPTESTAP